MKTVTKSFFIVLVAFLLIGCATSGPKFVEMKSSIPDISHDTGRIYIYRPSSFGAAVQPEVKLNGETVGKAVSWGFFYVDREPGKYEIMTSTEVKRKLSFILDKSDVLYVRLNIAWGFFVGHVYPELVESQDAEKEIQDCRYIGK